MFPFDSHLTNFSRDNGCDMTPLVSKDPFLETDDCFSGATASVLSALIHTQ